MNRGRSKDGTRLRNRKPGAPVVPNQQGNNIFKHFRLDFRTRIDLVEGFLVQGRMSVPGSQQKLARPLRARLRGCKGPGCPRIRREQCDSFSTGVGLFHLGPESRRPPRQFSMTTNQTCSCHCDGCNTSGCYQDFIAGYFSIK